MKYALPSPMGDAARALAKHILSHPHGDGSGDEFDTLLERLRCAVMAHPCIDHTWPARALHAHANGWANAMAPEESAFITRAVMASAQLALNFYKTKGESDAG